MAQCILVLRPMRRRQSKRRSELEAASPGDGRLAQTPLGQAVRWQK